jgi:hypothetical protein
MSMLQREINGLVSELDFASKDKAESPPTRDLMRRAKQCIEELLGHERRANEVADRLAKVLSLQAEAICSCGQMPKSRCDGATTCQLG